MKQIILILTLFSSLLLAEPEWAESYAKALEQAEKEQKMVLVMLSSEGCDACWYMESIVFEDDDLVDEITMNYIWVHIDINDDRVPEGLGYIGTPTFHFLNSEGKKIDRLDGGANIRDFGIKIREVKANNRSK